MSSDFTDPLLLDVLKSRRLHKTKAKDQDIGIRIRQLAQGLILLHAGGIPKLQVNSFASNGEVRATIVENGREIVAGKRLTGVCEKKGALADFCIADDDAFHRGHLKIMGSFSRDEIEM
jgi:hypothetical protein